MIETILLNYLNEKLEVSAFAEKPVQNVPKRYVLIEKVGGSEENYIKSATVAVQSYAESLYQAALLNEAVKDAMEDIVSRDDVSRSSLNTDYNYTDTSKKQYRYQAVFDLVYYDD